MIKNTTGGGAGIWKSNQSLLDNLGGLISEQEGLSYSIDGLAQQFQQLYPGYKVTTTPGAQSPQASVDTTLNTLNGALQSAQNQAQNFAAEQTTVESLEFKNQTAIGNLQAVQVSNEISRPSAADPDAPPTRDDDGKLSEHCRSQPAQQPDAKPACGASDYCRATTGSRHA